MNDYTYNHPFSMKIRTCLWRKEIFPPENRNYSFKLFYYIKHRLSILIIPIIWFLNIDVLYINLKILNHCSMLRSVINNIKDKIIIERKENIRVSFLFKVVFCSFILSFDTWFHVIFSLNPSKYGKTHRFSKNTPRRTIDWHFLNVLSIKYLF